MLFNLLYWHSESSQCAAAAEIVTLQWRLHWSASYTPAAEARRDESSSSLFCCSSALSLSPMPSCARFPWSYRVSLSGSLQLRSLCIVRLITPDSASQTELAITRGPAISSWCSVTVYSHFNLVGAARSVMGLFEPSGFECDFPNNYFYLWLLSSKVKKSASLYTLV